MPIINPSQYDCNQMEPGDLVYVKKRNSLYKWYREHFKKHLTKIRVRKDWNEPETYVTYYQEDCTLMHNWEIQCIQTYEYEVPCMISLDASSAGLTTRLLKSLNVGLYNTQIIFNNDITLTIPTNYFDMAIRANQNTLKNIQDARIIRESLKFQRYKGYHFKKQVEERNLEKWIPSYCSICGEPVYFEFKEDKVVVTNKCSCGTLKLYLDEMSYDELAVWYANQINPNVTKTYEEFWFKG